MSLKLKGVTKSYGDTKVLRDITFDLIDGELMVLLGPSGSGKSKTLEIVAGIEEPDSGEVIINGVDVLDVAPRKRGVGFVFQDYSLFPHKTVYENIAFGLKMRGENEVKEKVEEIAREMRVYSLLDRFPNQISGGQQQRAALARALIINPELLLFDEPLSSLDQRVREALRKTLKTIQRKHKVTTLYVTHDYVEAIALADRIAILKSGRILQTGTPDEIFYKPNSKEVAEFTGMKNIFEGEVKDSSKEGSSITFKELNIHVSRELPKMKVIVCIRPESIMFVRPDRPSTFENSFEGRISEVESFGSAMQSLGVEVGESIFYVNVPNHVVEKMGLGIGKDVKISLKKEKIHVLLNGEIHHV
jgi:ABC-type Fe3+/spermidine/putrescine transport system ATPase subunit